MIEVWTPKSGTDTGAKVEGSIDPRPFSASFEIRFRTKEFRDQVGIGHLQHEVGKPGADRRRKGDPFRFRPAVNRCRRSSTGGYVRPPYASQHGAKHRRSPVAAG